MFAKLTNISEEYRRVLATMGPCQPKPLELPGKKFPYTNNRSFHEHYYYKTINHIKVKRLWLSYSPINDKMYCTSCKLFGTPEAQKQPLATEGSNNWSMICEKIKLHENKPYHLTSEINRGMYTNCQRVDMGLQTHKNQLVAENREIVLTIFRAVLFLARQNVSLRGHNETLTSDNRGNFLELVHLLGIYNPYLSCHLNKISENAQKNRLTFLSNDSQNKMLEILSDMVREQILSEIKKSGMFAVIIDTTTDLSKLEQLAFVVRFVTYNGTIQERLVALEVARDASGKGLFNLFFDICAKYHLEWKKELIAQAYDGASTMQGEYQGLRSHIQSQNPRAVYIWCFAHILNLVVVDVCESNVDINIFISNIQALSTFMSARKRTADFVEAQLSLYPNMRVQRMKNLSTTRWTSHDRAVNVVFLKYLAVIVTLENLTKSPDTSTACQAKGLYPNITSFKFIAIMILMKKIFDITTPLSNYLQSSTLDFVEALSLVDSAQDRLKKLRTEEIFNNLMDEAKSFATLHNLEETSLKEDRIRRKTKMPGENCRDEAPTNVINKFKINVYFYTLDKIIGTLDSRFQSSRGILTDLSRLSYARIKDAAKNSFLPQNTFLELHKWLPEINVSNLQSEYLAFAASFESLEVGVTNPEISKISAQQSTNINENDEIDSESENEEVSHTNDKQFGFASRMVQMMSSYGLMASFPNLYLAFKAMCTIPASSASAERVFSKVR